MKPAYCRITFYLDIALRFSKGCFASWQDINATTWNRTAQLSNNQILSWYFRLFRYNIRHLIIPSFSLRHHILNKLITIISRYIVVLTIRSFKTIGYFILIWMNINTSTHRITMHGFLSVKFEINNDTLINSLNLFFCHITKNFIY